MLELSLGNNIERFDNKSEKNQINVMNIRYEDMYEDINSLVSSRLVISSGVVIFASSVISRYGYDTFATVVAAAGLIGIAYGVKSLLSGKSNLAKYITTKEELGYKPESLEKNILKIVSEQ